MRLGEIAHVQRRRCDLFDTTPASERSDQSGHESAPSSLKWHLDWFRHLLQGSFVWCNTDTQTALYQNMYRNVPHLALLAMWSNNNWKF